MSDDYTLLPRGVEPHLAHHGRVSFITIPARDPITSAVFYEAVFGWTLTPQDDQRVWSTLEPGDNERVPFSDTPSGLAGAFVAARGPSSEGVLLHVYAESIQDVLEEIEGRGCEVVEPIHTVGGIRMAHFRDPGGNVVGIWEGPAG